MPNFHKQLVQSDAQSQVENHFEVFFGVHICIPQMAGGWYKQLFRFQVLSLKKALEWSKPLSNATTPKDVSQCLDLTALSEHITVAICITLLLKNSHHPTQ